MSDKKDKKDDSDSCGGCIVAIFMTVVFFWLLCNLFVCMEKVARLERVLLKNGTIERSDDERGWAWPMDEDAGKKRMKQ